MIIVGPHISTFPATSATGGHVAEEGDSFKFYSKFSRNLQIIPKKKKRIVFLLHDRIKYHQIFTSIALSNKIFTNYFSISELII